MKILVTGAFQLNNEFKKTLENFGYEVYFHKDEREEVRNPEIYDAVICNGLFLYSDITKFKNLKHIQLTSAGYDRVNVEYCKKNGIKLFNVGATYSIPMAEWAITQILDIYKGTQFFHENQKEKLWIKKRDIKELYGKNAVIAGFGNVGKETAKRLKAFDVNITAVDIITPDSNYFDSFYHIDNLADAVKNADILILTLPLTESTRGIISKEIFDKLPVGCVLINISRGAVINETDLINASKNKKFFGVSLDVFCEEPLCEKSELWNLENFVITPHNSFVGENNQKRLTKVIYDNLKMAKEV